MKKIAILFLLSLSIFAAGCSDDASKGETAETTSATLAETKNDYKDDDSEPLKIKSEQTVAEGTSENILEKLSKVQESGKIKDCAQFSQKYIKKQCEETIRLNKK